MKTVNLELAQQLKEAGYPQEKSCFNWLEYENIDKTKGISITFDGNNDPRKICASPTADEILDRLTDKIEKNNLNYGFRLWFVDYTQYVRHYCCNYFVMDHGKEGQLIKDNFIIEQTPANAVAKMWLYLKKEGLL